MLASIIDIALLDYVLHRDCNSWHILLYHIDPIMSIDIAVRCVVS